MSSDEGIAGVGDGPLLAVGTFGSQPPSSRARANRAEAVGTSAAARICVTPLISALALAATAVATESSLPPSHEAHSGRLRGKSTGLEELCQNSKTRLRLSPAAPAASAKARCGSSWL